MVFNILKIDHIGIAVENIDEILNFYRLKLGLEFTGTEYIEDQQVKTAFLKIGDMNLELLEPTGDDSPVRKFLTSGKKGIHHIAVEVDNILKALDHLKGQGVRLIDEKPRVGAHTKKIAFIHPSSTGGVLLELCQNIE